MNKSEFNLFVVYDKILKKPLSYFTLPYIDKDVLLTRQLRTMLINNPTSIFNLTPEDYCVIDLGTLEAIDLSKFNDSDITELCKIKELL